ncbi:sensor histidine kinase [Leifsonia sp. Root112D2]|uniref:sensor histidine kinase n=1 Tax=Leifsonia sp. Root112D2 TaxID=1736426 RepID=UPI0006F6FE37|nr:sensor histidine kinase [Leifsonia sp. Root112D2]KQV06880.1 hypothetical protein ASC63_05805 [Leifsonia sp. Root112D2]
MHATASAAAFEAWARPTPDRRGYRNDAILAVVFALGAALSLSLYARAGFYPHPAPVWVDVLWVAFIALPLAARRRWPCTVALVVTATFVVGQQLSVPEMLVGNITTFFAFYTVGAWHSNRARAAAVRGLIIVSMFIWLFGSLWLQVGDPTAVPNVSRAGLVSPYLAIGLIQIFTNVLYFGAAYYFGDSSYRTARNTAALETRTRELAAERERTAAQAIALERLRIARELHDVVAHHVSLMGVQAGAARRVLERDPATATRSLEAIESSARTAVDELHRLLTALRSDEMDAAGRLPETASASSTRSLAQLDELVDRANEAGLTTTLQRVGTPRPVPATIGLSAYRIVQEALTNTRKHAGAAASATVRIRYLAGALELEVTDTGGGSRRNAGSGLGHIGMRERVAAVGGQIEIGPKPRGGFRVRARFELTASASASLEPAS